MFVASVCPEVKWGNVENSLEYEKAIIFSVSVSRSVVAGGHSRFLPLLGEAFCKIPQGSPS